MKDKRPWIIIVGMMIFLIVPSVVRLITQDDEQVIDDRKEVTARAADTTTELEIGVTDYRNMPSEAIGIIEIPSLDISYPIYEGADEAQLSKGIGHVPDTAGLLKQGNCVLCGHNGSRRGLYFTTLSHIRKGAKVNIVTSDHRERTYSVVSTRVVDPYDTTVCRKTKKEILTLFTCAYHGTRRFVAECKPIETEDENHEVQYQNQ